MLIVKIFIILFFCFSCTEKKIVKNIYIDKTQKIQVQKKWESEYKISYLWSKPKGPDNHQAKWIVNNNIMLFTPYKIGKYSIVVSIENSMGIVLGKENFDYNVINKKSNPNTLNSQIPKKINKKQVLKIKKNIKVDKYTIQISSWNTFEDAQKDMHQLNDLGYDSYIDKKKINKKIWYRVRIGGDLNYNESLLIQEQLEQQGIKGVWVDKN